MLYGMLFASRTFAISVSRTELPAEAPDGTGELAKEWTSMNTRDSNSDNYDTGSGASAGGAGAPVYGDDAMTSESMARVNTFDTPEAYGLSGGSGSTGGAGSSNRSPQEVQDQVAGKTGEIIDQAKDKA